MWPKMVKNGSFIFFSTATDQHKLFCRLFPTANECSTDLERSCDAPQSLRSDFWLDTFLTSAIWSYCKVIVTCGISQNKCVKYSPELLFSVWEERARIIPCLSHDFHSDTNNKPNAAVCCNARDIHTGDLWLLLSFFPSMRFLVNVSLFSLF